MRTKLGHRGPIQVGGTQVPAAVSTPSAGATLSSPGTYQLSNSTGGGARQYALPSSPKVGTRWTLIVTSFTTSTGTDKVVVSAPAGMSFKAASDQDNLVFDAADEAVEIEVLSTARFGIVSNVGSVASSSST